MIAYRVLALSLLLSLADANAQEAQQQAADSCLQKAVAVRVIDRKSQSGVPELSAINFRSKFKGKPLQIRSVTLDRGPRRVLVMLDTSRSMLEPGYRWEAARRLALAAVESTQPSNLVAFMAFASTVEQKVGFPAGHDSALAALRSLPEGKTKFPKGLKRTALLDALTEGLTLFEPPAFGDTIIVVTDGEDNASRANQGTVVRALGHKGVRILVLFLPTEPPTPMGSIAMSTYGPWLLPDGTAFFQQWSARPYTMSGIEPEQVSGLAEQSGGQMLFVDIWGMRKSPSQALPGVTARLAVLTNELYRIDLQLTQPILKPERWDLRVVDDKGKDLKSAQVLFPRKIAACSGNQLTFAEQ